MKQHVNEFTNLYFYSNAQKRFCKPLHLQQRFINPNPQTYETYFSLLYGSVFLCRSICPDMERGENYSPPAGGPA